MAVSEELQPTGEKMRKTIRWISETVLEFPHKTRGEILKEAQVRFDLSPAECAFLDKNFDDRDAG